MIQISVLPPVSEIVQFEDGESTHTLFSRWVFVWKGTQGAVFVTAFLQDCAKFYFLDGSHFVLLVPLPDSECSIRKPKVQYSVCQL